MRHSVRNAPACLVFVTMLCSAPAMSHAAVIFSNLGPGDSFVEGALKNLGGLEREDSAQAQNSAMPFTVPAGTDYVFTSADLGLVHFEGTNLLEILLTADGGGVPGAVLETMTVTVPASDPVWAGTLVTATSAIRPILEAGSTYWIATSTGSSDFLGGWNLEFDIDNLGLTAYQFETDDGTFSPWLPLEDVENAFRVNAEAAAAPVPEPSTLALGGIGGLLALGFAWRRRRAA